MLFKGWFNGAFPSLALSWFKDMDRAKGSVVFAFILVILLIIAYTVRGSLIIIYVSTIFAIVLSPAVQWVCRIKIGRLHPDRGISILLIIGSVLLAFTLLFLFGLPPVINDIQDLFTKLPDGLSDLREHMRHIPVLNQLDENRLKQYSASVISSIPGILGSIANGIASIIGIVVLTAYLILEGEHVFGWMLSLFPPDKRDQLKPVLIRAAGRMRGWLVGQAILMLILGSASVIVFGLLGVRYFYLLGVFAGLANFIPLLGPILTVIIAGLVAAFDSWSKLAGVLVFFLVYQQIENAFLTPKIMKSQAELSASAVLVALLIGAELAGIPGAMMAVPTAILASVLIDAFIIRENIEQRDS